MSAASVSSGSERVWFIYEDAGSLEIQFLFDYVKKSQATQDDAGYELTIALKDKDFAERNGIDQEYLIKCFEIYISRDIIEPFPSRIVAAIPSSRPDNFHRAIDEVAKRVNDRFGNPDRPYLKRIEKVDSAHLGGSRDSLTHERTIDAPYKGWIRGRHFLLIDDVATTCTSMRVCRQKLLNAGAASVECAVFSRTFDHYRDSRTSQSFLTRQSRASVFLKNSKLDKTHRSRIKPQTVQQKKIISKEGSDCTNAVLRDTEHTDVGSAKKSPGFYDSVVSEVREIDGQHFAFLVNGRAIPVPHDRVEYVKEDLGEPVGIGYIDCKDINGNPATTFMYENKFRRNLQINDLIEHRHFGIGQVESCLSADTILVRFLETGSRKKILWPCAPIKPVDQLEYFKRRYDQGERKLSPFMLVELTPGILWEKELDLLDESARAGNVDAAIKLGKELEGKGKGSDALAVKYYKIAYDLGERFTSAFRLARYYSGGMESYLSEDERTTEPNYALAEKYYRESIEAGDKYASTNNLAHLIIDERPDEAIELLEMAVEAGNKDSAAKLLADHYKDSDKDKAEGLYRMSSDEGNVSATYSLAKLIAYDRPDEAKKLFKSTLDSPHKANALEWLGYLSWDTPAIAKEYFRAAIDAGERYASPNYLAQLLDINEEFDEYIRLFKMAVESGNNVEPALNLGRALMISDKVEAAKYLKISGDAGSARGCNEYALCVAETEPITAKEYYTKAIELGDVKYAPYNLGQLVIDDDRDEGLKALELAVENGNSSAMNTLALAIEPSDPAGCIELLEKAVLNGELTCAPINLAWRIRDFDRKRAVSLLQTCIGNNGANSAVDVLAEILLPEDVEEVIGEIEKAYDRGYMAAVFNIYGFNDCVPSSFVSRIPLSPTKDMNAMTLMAIGVFWLGQHTEAARKKAVQFFERAIDVGNESASACNLATILFKDDPARATQLYELALKDNQTEAKLGLGWLLEHDDPKRSEELLDDAYSSSDIGESLWFIAEYLRGVDPKQSKKLFNKAKEVGSKKAEYSLNRWFD